MFTADAHPPHSSNFYGPMAWCIRRRHKSSSKCASSSAGNRLSENVDAADSAASSSSYGSNWRHNLDTTMYKSQSKPTDSLIASSPLHTNFPLFHRSRIRSLSFHWLSPVKQRWPRLSPLLNQNFVIFLCLFLSILLWPLVVVNGFECTTRFGYYPHPRRCNRYYVCNFGFAFPETCTIGLQFSLQLGTCDWPRNVNCTEETGFALRPNQPFPPFSAYEDSSDEQLDDNSNIDPVKTDAVDNKTIRHSSIKFSFTEGKRTRLHTTSNNETIYKRTRRRRPQIPITVNVNLFSHPVVAADTAKPMYMPDVSVPEALSTTLPPPATTTTMEPPRPFPAPEVGSYADPCDEARCVLPWCRCASADIPGKLNVSEMPQIVLISFDNAVNELNFGLYQQIFNGRRVNPNGCPISATFFVSHQWTKYNLVQNLFAAGHEIASLGITGEYYDNMSAHWQDEIAGQRELLTMYANISRNNIKGMRAPFLRPGGNKQMKMLHENKFLYDSSYPIWEDDPPYFPFTYDYLTNSYCMVDDCVEQSFPSMWEVPLVMWRDATGARCHTPDTCNTDQSENGTYQLLKNNFDRHYKQNRAPFTVFLQSPWFAQEGRKTAFLRFLDEILNFNDVYAITITQAIEWLKRPTSLHQLKLSSSLFTAWRCDQLANAADYTCTRPKKCNPWFENEKSVRFFETCMDCPRDYPWTDNVVVTV